MPTARVEGKPRGRRVWLLLPGFGLRSAARLGTGRGPGVRDEVLEAERVAVSGERQEHLADPQSSFGREQLTPL